ncbi:hypothetical protein CYPRO_2343 [Cyclonatronum proteinivorum]|uniref:Uncharacterized protein n=1 Tax=Cyclonatronum proteinivorum TaxID=1457365 RepID=A0A345UM83_9BACT|nr:hypothetical protein CYPRO_2343 [Cyclonatronum proteinivorum]
MTEQIRDKRFNSSKNNSYGLRLQVKSAQDMYRAGIVQLSVY